MSEQKERLIAANDEVNYNIVMSQNPAQRRINLLSQKYKRYCEQFKDQDRKNSWKFLQNAIQKCSLAWKKLIPVAVRGWTSQFQEFNYMWQNELGKPCTNELINCLGVEKSLMNGDKKVLIGLLYSGQSLTKVIAFLNSLQLERIHRQLTFCPINIKSQYFQQCYQQKIGYYDQSLLLIWKGLFNQVIVLGRFRLSEPSLWKEIERMMENRMNYQQKIKQRAFMDNSSTLQINK